MSTNNFRVQFPLWNIALSIILMIFTYGVVYFFDLYLNNFEGFFSNANGNLVINWSLPGVLSLFLGHILLVAFFIVYFIKLKQHNKTNPSKKLSPFTFLKLNEFIEDDELFSQVTQKATKKVYVFYSQMLPLVILLMMFPFNRYVYIVVIFLLIIIQNLIYYRYMRMYISE